MRLWLIKQNDVSGWDTYDSAVVSAETEDAARFMHPSNGTDIRLQDSCFKSWTLDPTLVTVVFIGEASPWVIGSGVICASFNAG